MSLEALVLALLVGLVAGALAGFVVKGEGYGLIGDVLLGIGGSMVANSVVRTADIAPGGGWLAMVAVPFVGAVLLIAIHRIAQRMLWPVRS
jgi:uncharacterized membrane protein YeaQ/YmgE (transglycosylase-associated protein family)